MPPRSKRVKRKPSTSKESSDGLSGDAGERIEDGSMDSPVSTTVKAVDTALLDEEEAPELPEEGSAAPTKKPRQYTAGRGGFNELKSFKGQVYSGMAVGGSHTWNYDQGVWKETKEEPDLWKIDYKTTKRRARNAPKGSGAPVGTEYHWFIIGHQVSHSVDAF